MKTITEEQKKLVENNHNLIYSFLHKYNLDVDEFYGLAAIGLCKEGSTYDNSISSFSTYAYKCMFTTVMCELRKEKAKKNIPKNQIVYYQTELENSNGDSCLILNFIPSEENVEDNVLSEVLFDEYAKGLKQRDKEIFKMFRYGYKQADIGKALGCSQAQVSRVKKKLVEYLAS